MPSTKHRPPLLIVGSGLHVHVSLQDAAGHNIFAATNPLDSKPLRHAIGGTLNTLADGMAVCAPGPNSYRRFRSEAYVPLHPTWSINNRGSAIRVPIRSWAVGVSIIAYDSWFSAKKAVAWSVELMSSTGRFT